MQWQLNPVLIKVSELSSALQFFREKRETHRKSEVRLSPQGTVEQSLTGEGKPSLCWDSVPPPPAIPGLDRGAPTDIFQRPLPVFIS
jgi:hypothetical protein